MLGGLATYGDPCGEPGAGTMKPPGVRTYPPGAPVWAWANAADRNAANGNAADRSVTAHAEMMVRIVLSFLLGPDTPIKIGQR